MILAQLIQNPNPDANSFLQFWLSLALILGVVVAGVTIWAMTRKKQRTEISPQPLSVSKTPKRYNHDLAESRHSEVERRLNSHEAEIEQIWTTMRKEDADIRKEQRDYAQRVLLALGRIEGRLGIKQPNDEV